MIINIGQLATEREASLENVSQKKKLYNARKTIYRLSMS